MQQRNKEVGVTFCQIGKTTLAREVATEFEAKPDTSICRISDISGGRGSVKNVRI